MRLAIYGVLVLVVLAGCELAAWRTTTGVLMRSIPPTPPPAPKPCRCSSSCVPESCTGTCCSPIPCVWRK